MFGLQGEQRIAAYLKVDDEWKAEIVASEKENAYYFGRFLGC